MITSLKNWRQRLFKNRAIIGVVYDESYLCLVQITLQKGSIRIGPWIYEPLQAAGLSKQLGAALDGQFKTSLIGSSLPQSMVEIIDLELSSSLDSVENEALVIKKLAKQSEFPDLTRIAVGRIETVSPSPLCISDKTHLQHYLELVAPLQKELVSLDWQPLALFRILWLMIFLVTYFPVFRFSLLEAIKGYHTIHFEALGAALNGLYYVAY